MKRIYFVIIMFISLFIITGCSNKKQIIIYSPVEEIRGNVLKKKLAEKFPNIDIIVQYMSTGNLSAKLNSEKEDIEADIILDMETAYMEKVKDAFVDLSFVNTDKYLDDVIVSSKYLPWIKYSTTIIIDKEYFDKHNLEIPNSYEDLLDKKYKNLIAMPDPKTSGTGYSFYLNYVNLYGFDKAKDYFNKLKDNLREFSISGAGPLNLLKQKEIAIAMGMTYDAVLAINDNYKFEIVELDTGAPYNTTSLAIVKGKENKEHVKEIFNYLVNDYGVYDKENYAPEILLKDQEIKLKNYPKMKSGLMTDIDSISRKDELLDKWDTIFN